jgi:hypothetical protein
MLLILLIPFSLFLDFGINFVCYVRGSASTSNLFFEITLDMLSVLIIFARFIIQNIRFFFILIAISELFE